MCLGVIVVTAVELWRSTDGGGGRCNVERSLLCTHFILKGWLRGVDSSNGSGRQRGNECHAIVLWLPLFEDRSLDDGEVATHSWLSAMTPSD
jgi:hypothetical protein